MVNFDACYKRLCFLFLLVSTSSWAQLTDFTLGVAVQHEVCAGQGTLTFTVANTTPGSNISYSVYLLPNTTTPVATINTNVLTGLVAGTYSVIATQTLGNQSNSQTQQVVIQNQIVPLQYTLQQQQVLCGNDGKITVMVTQGTAVGYEIISGPVLAPLQTSNVFTGLTAGLYTIRVYDACGEAVVQAHTLFEGNAGLGITVEPNMAIDCDVIQVSLVVAPSNIFAIAYPVTFSLTINPATGPPITSNQVLTGPNTGQTITYSETIPYFQGEVYSYEIVVSDNCGNSQVISNTIDNTYTQDPTASAFTAGCDGGGGTLANVTEVILTDAPDAYTGPVPQDMTGDIAENNTLTIDPLPPGTYTFTVVGICGETSELELIIPEGGGGGSPPGVSVQEGCAPGFGTMLVNGSFSFITLTAGPAAYSNSYPIDMTPLVNPTGMLSLANLPAGTYSFHCNDSCGNLHDVNGIINGYYSNTDVDLIEHCGAFDIGLYHTSNGINLQSFWLQKFDATAGVWEHPGNGNDYPENTIPNIGNSLGLTNNSINYNLAFNGQFRILKSFRVFSGGSFGFEYCYEVLYEFTINPGPIIEDVFTFSCSPNQYDTAVHATGIAPLIYRITQMNGGPFTVPQNGTGVFTGLQAATYNFQVEDGCGNIVNMLFDVPAPVTMDITATNMCPGESGQLSVPYFPFLNYQWWHEDDPANILSTTGILEFDPFQYPQDVGTYFVHVTSSLPLSCVDIELSFTVNDAGLNPSAGEGTTYSLCDLPDTLNLFDLLSGSYNTDGVWTQTGTGGSLSGNVWTPGDLPAGTYTFDYAVTGLCGSDNSTVVINLMNAPTNLIASAEFGCAGENLQLTASASQGSAFSWTGPNGFTADQPNPLLENATSAMSGTYWVTASIGDCSTDPVPVEVQIAALPEAIIEAGCVNKQYQLNAEPLNNSFDPSTVSYAWTGPNGFTQSGNPITVTGNGSGQYSVTITTPDGCSTTINQVIATTVCVFPLGISPDDNGYNDDYDLTGFDVRKLQIFNRYGVTVYERENYINEWRGQDYKDRPLPAGAYYFLAELNSGGYESGWVYVNRRH